MGQVVVVHAEAAATAASASTAPRPLLRLVAVLYIGTAAPKSAVRTAAADCPRHRDHTSAPMPPANATAAEEPEKLGNMRGKQAQKPDLRLWKSSCPRDGDKICCNNVRLLKQIVCTEAKLVEIESTKSVGLISFHHRRSRKDALRSVGRGHRHHIHGRGRHVAKNGAVGVELQPGSDQNQSKKNINFPLLSHSCLPGCGTTEHQMNAQACH